MKHTEHEHPLHELHAALHRLHEATEGLRQEIHTVNATPRPRGAAEARPILGGGNWAVSQSRGRLAGYSLRETTGAAAAVVRLRDGIDVSGNLIVTISLVAGESTRDSWLPGGIAFVYGLYVEVVSGQIEGAIYLGAAP